MVDAERFKRQSPVTTASTAVKCKRLCSDIRVATEKKVTATGPMRKQGYISVQAAFPPKAA